MKRLVTGRHVEITPVLRQMIDRKLLRLDRVLNDSAVSAQVVLARERYRCVVEVVLHVRGDHMLTGIGEGQTWPTALSAAIAKVAQQAHTVKGKWDARRRRSVPPKRRQAVAPAPPAVVPDPRYVVKSLTVAAAAAAVGPKDGAFVVFRSHATDAVSVAYRRADGRIGLIDTEG